MAKKKQIKKQKKEAEKPVPKVETRQPVRAQSFSTREHPGSTRFL